MIRSDYESKVSTVLNTINSIDCNPITIPRVKVCNVWNATNPNRPTVPGYWMSDAMERWGKENGYTLVWSTTKSGRRRNVMLVKKDI